MRYLEAICRGAQEAFDDMPLFLISGMLIGGSLMALRLGALGHLEMIGGLVGAVLLAYAIARDDQIN